MGKLAAIIKREYLERVRTKWFIIGTALVPIFIVGLTVLPILFAVNSGTSSEASKVLILDASGSPLGERIAAAIVRDSALGTPAFARTEDILRQVSPPELAAAESSATAGVLARSFAGYLVIDSATLSTGKTRYAGRNASSLSDMEELEAVVRQRALRYRMERSGLDPARIDSLTRYRASVSTERVSSRGREGSGEAGAIVGFVIAFMMYGILIIYGQTIMRSVLEEKTTRVAEVVISSVSPDKLLAGKIIGVGLLGLTQVAIWLATAVAVGMYLGPILMLFGAPPEMGAAASAGAAQLPLPSFSPVMVGAFLLFFVLGVTFYCILWAAAGATISSEQEAQQAAMPLMFLLIPTIVLVNPIMMNPSSTLAEVMSWLPFSSPIVMPMRMTLVSISPAALLGSIGVLALSCYGALWVGARIYRTGLLMYGKRPALGEILRWVARSR